MSSNDEDRLERKRQLLEEFEREREESGRRNLLRHVNPVDIAVDVASDVYENVKK
jgi:hypothetical protein